MKIEILILYLVYIIFAYGEIHDPMNIFCGSINCYDILNVQSNSSSKDIKKAYRKLSLSHHPDKNKEENATEVFRLISKAYEVLDKNESRALFDYYLAHPYDYFKVSGKHYYRSIPKSDVTIVLLVVILIITAFLYVVQYEKWKRITKYIKNAAENNLNPKQGGTKQTQEIYLRAVELYSNHMKEAKANGIKYTEKVKMIKDPLFVNFIDQVIAEVKIEGGYRKPVLTDLFAYQLAIFPFTFFQWARKYHRRYISEEPLSEQDKEEMTREAVGAAVWASLTPKQQQDKVAAELWKPEVQDRMLRAQQQQQLDGEEEPEDMPRHARRAAKKKQ